MRQAQPVAFWPTVGRFDPELVAFVAGDLPFAGDTLPQS
jgi:hypothetical protein